MDCVGDRRARLPLCHFNPPESGTVPLCARHLEFYPSKSLFTPAVCCSVWFGATASTLVMGVQPLTEHDVPDQLAHLEHHMHP